MSFAGSMITYVAIPFQAYTLSRSSLVVGLVSLAELIPILIMSFVGGALADAVDRRRMVRLTELGLLGAVGVLVLNAAQSHPQLWVLFVVVVAAAALDALQRPSRDALVPRIVTHDMLPAASALEVRRSSRSYLIPSSEEREAERREQPLGPSVPLVDRKAGPTTGQASADSRGRTARTVIRIYTTRAAET